MSRRTNAVIAGVTFLIYIAVGMSGFVVPRSAPVAALLPVITSFSALLLGVTLYALTRGQNHDLALLAMGCRILEAAPGEGTLYFAVGSLLFCWLFLRGRMIPLLLAVFGVASSVILVIFLPLQIAGHFGGAGNWQSPVTWSAWLPMLVF